MGFLEVETPILWAQAGGANARPFLTSSNAFGNDLPLHLRIAPELFLKQLVIGGLERVYEIGKVFRNEGIDATHNPEFTSCELYMAHADCDTMIRLTEDLLRHVVHHATGGLKLAIADGPADPTDGAQTKYHAQARAGAVEGDDTVVIDFEPPFRKLDVLETLAEHGIILPENCNDPEALPELLKICAERNWRVSAPHTNARVLDKMIGEVIEPLCIQPTFIMNHPICLSPLAKTHRANPKLTERFELFINGKEYCNAYSELNIPSEQYSRLSAQHALRSPTNSDSDADGSQNLGDEESHPLDTPYCEALEYGLPPTGGWGLGIDRLIMLLARVPHIRDVIYFPIMRPMQTTDAKDAKVEEK
jgi:lysyl-tRNA synthetase class 2